jgi:hypothetical protein
MEQHAKRRRRGKRNENQQKDTQKEQSKQTQSKAPAGRIPLTREITEQIQKLQMENLEAIKTFRQIKHICPRCNLPIQELSSALPDHASGEPLHFECALDIMRERETCEPNEKLAYIGQGRFGVMHFANANDEKHFTIRRIIEWETRDAPASWRGEIAGLFSQV